MLSSSLTVYNLYTVVRAILNMYMLPSDDDFVCTWLTTRFVAQRVPLVEQELLALPGAPEFNLGFHGVRIALFIVSCRSLFVFFLLSIVFSVFNLWLLITTWVCQIFLMIIIPPLHRRGVYYFTSVRPSVLPKIFFVAFFSATIDGRNLIFGHKLYIGMAYCGKRFWTRQIPTSCLPT